MNRTVYNHSDGFTLAFKVNALTATDDDGAAVSFCIGSTGLMESGNALLTLAAKHDEKFTSERAGAAIGRDLIDELLTVRGMPQAEAFRVIQDKLYALSKLEQLDAATGGFAGAVVNVMEIGIANLPKFKQEECLMKARLYALAWRVLPYACCAPLGAMMGLQLLQLLGSFK